MGGNKRVVKPLRVAALGASAVVASFVGVVALQAVAGSETPAAAGEQQEEQPIGGLPFLTETVLAAKIAALASGNVIAGPGQVYVTRDYEKEDRKELWTFDTGEHYSGRPLKDVTLTVQKLGRNCGLGFSVEHAQQPGRVGSSGMVFRFGVAGEFDESASISQVRAFRISYTATIHEEPCLFFWVLRETP